MADATTCTVPDSWKGILFDWLNNDIKTDLIAFDNAGIDFVAMPICSITDIYRSDMNQYAHGNSMDPTQWRKVMAVIPKDIDVDHPDPTIRKQAEDVLRRHLEHCAFLNVFGVLLNAKPAAVNLCRIVSEFLLKSNTPQQFDVLFRVPLCYADDDVTEDPMDCWMRINQLCKCRNTGVVVEITADLPPTKDKVKRWVGANLAGFVLNESLFGTSDKGQPTLGSRHMCAALALFGHARYVIFEPENADTSRASFFAQLYANMFTKHENKKSQSRKPYIKAYADVVQIPLQPLGDQLKNDNYSTFELDTVKYDQYQLAIDALLKNCFYGRKIDSDPIVVIVAGAGRGPLVTRAVKALEKQKYSYIIYAVEKNPSAAVCLRADNIPLWKGCVRIVEGDIRTVQLEHKAHIMISEMLGSFGNNEISAECMDGAAHLLRDDGIYIPSRYNSFLAPIQAMGVNQDIDAISRYNATVTLQTPLVVHLFSHSLLAGALPLNEFAHPNKENKSYDRYDCLQFTVEQEGMLTGFAGYFEATLYENIKLSTHPTKHTENMASWFEMYFPISQPHFVRKADVVEVHFWRCTDNNTRAWYEWCVVKPFVTMLHNVNGVHGSISLFNR